MVLVFNELSISQNLSDFTTARNIFKIFTDTCLKSREFNFDFIRVLPDFWNVKYYQDISIHEFMSSYSNKTHRDILRKIIRKPYLAEGTERVDDEYILFSFKIDVPDDLKMQLPVGLAYSILLNTITVSFETSNFWKNTKITLIQNSDVYSEKITAKNVSNISHFEIHQDYIQNQQPISLEKTTLLPKEKRIKLSGTHHGNDMLKVLSDKLVYSEYVIEIINSIDNCPTCKNFIKECFPNGQIDIVLISSDAGYALRVQTTGTNMRETKHIAEIIKLKFS